MPISDEDVRLAVYQSCVARTGSALDVSGLATALGSEAAAIRNHLFRLVCERHLVLDEQERIVMAHPFAAVPMGFSCDGVFHAVVGWLCVGRVRDPAPRGGSTRSAGGHPVSVVRFTTCVGGESRPSARWRSGRAFPGTGRTNVGRRCAHVRTPTPLLRRRLRRRLAEAHLECIGLRHGPGNPMAAGP